MCVCLYICVRFFCFFLFFLLVFIFLVISLLPMYGSIKKISSYRSMIYRIYHYMLVPTAVVPRDLLKFPPVTRLHWSGVMILILTKRTYASPILMERCMTYSCSLCGDSASVLPWLLSLGFSFLPLVFRFFLWFFVSSFWFFVSSFLVFRFCPLYSGSASMLVWFCLLVLLASLWFLFLFLFYFGSALWFYPRLFLF